MREELVVVTVEYRTGILGFLSDETKNLPGNLALTDVLLALRWVKEVVEDFGGDPNSVTLAGYGQGATIAHLLSINPLSSSELCDHTRPADDSPLVRSVLQVDPAELRLSV